MKAQQRKDAFSGLDPVCAVLGPPVSAVSATVDCSRFFLLDNCTGGRSILNHRDSRAASLLPPNATPTKLASSVPVSSVQVFKFSLPFPRFWPRCPRVWLRPRQFFFILFQDKLMYKCGRARKDPIKRAP